jgi:hypothetical protein
MTNDPISDDVRVFLDECIDSVAELEALLLLCESPDQDWRVSELARRLYVDEAEAGKILSSLVSCELAITDGTLFRYQARDTERHMLVGKVAATYARSLVPVTKLIHDKTTGIRKFADAFKIRKDK